MAEEKLYASLFCLLRMGLWEQHREDAAQHLPLSPATWESLYQLAINHTVEGVVFDGIQQLPATLLPPKQLLLRWTVRMDTIERRNKWMNQIIAAQARFFSRQGIVAVMLKGQGLANCYANPARRICGDIDWYLPVRADQDKLYRILLEQGTKAERDAGFSFSFLWDNCETEVHQRLFDLHNPFMQGYLRNLEDQQQPAQQSLRLAGQDVVLPAPLLTFIQVNAHILKHLLSFGIGMRQLCDSARICYHYSREIDGEHLQQIYRKLGILKWINLLHVLLVKDIGLDPAYLPFPLDKTLDAGWMTREILTAGNFGFHDKRVDLEREEQTKQRVDSFKRWRRNFGLYLPYAPMETIFFPLVQYYSRLKR